MPRVVPYIRASVLAALICFCIPWSQAQTRKTSPQGPLVVKGLGQGTVALDGPWQFHTGDDMAWANPNFDDSAWNHLNTDKSWGMQGYPNKSGYAWYRRRLTFIAGTDSPRTMAILIPAVQDAYQLYWNGHLVGSYAGLPPHPVYYFDPRPRTFNLGPPESGVLAVRVWKAPFASFDSGKEGGFDASPLVGSPKAIAAALGSLNYKWLRSQQFSFALNSLYLLIALLSLIAWLRDRSQWVVFWVGCFALNQPFLLLLSSARLPVPENVALLIDTPIYVLADISLWFLLLWLLELRDDKKLVRLMTILAVVYMAGGLLDSLAQFAFILPNPTPEQIFDGIISVEMMLMELIPFFLIGLAVLRRKRLDGARWTVALFAFLTQLSVTSSYAFSNGSRFTHVTLGEKIKAPLFTVAGNAVNAQTLFGLLLMISLVYAVYRYSVENRLRQSALEEEYRNARAVQQVLVPEDIPSVPGFSIQSVYKPFGEVGGDFFQILPTGDGGVLVIIGDVSGKGMPAAMTVSLLVGTARTLAHYTQSPGAILGAMNQRMLARSHGGFTTCLVLRCSADGNITVANAGHIAPYLAGKELSIENGLPLGLSADATYAESSYHLAPDEPLTLMTDGVAEARQKNGALLGFEATAALSVQPAEAIAEAAIQFGQEDDITVLSINRTLDPVLV